MLFNLTRNIVTTRAHSKQTILTTRMRFELTRAEHNGLAVHRLNHSATTSWNVTKVASTALLQNKYAARVPLTNVRVSSERIDSMAISHFQTEAAKWRKKSMLDKANHVFFPSCPSPLFYECLVNKVRLESRLDVTEAKTSHCFHPGSNWGPSAC